MVIDSWTESYGERYFYNGQQYDMSLLQIDDCFLTINNTGYDKVYLYSKYEDCIKCPFLLEKKEPFSKNNATTFILDTKFPKLFRFLTTKKNVSLENDSDVIGYNYFSTFNEFGVYRFNINKDVIEQEVLKEPVNIYFSLITVLLIYSSIFFGLYLLRYFWSKFLKQENYDIKNEAINNINRIKSLDTFRGISIVIMIFSNYGHGGYPFLEHAIWNGLCVGDLAFPWFIWIMGVCIPISISYALKLKKSKVDLFKKILRRSCILFALGVFLSSGANLTRFRIFGILQRFSIAYIVIAPLNLLTLKEVSGDNPKEKSNRSNLKDVLSLSYQWILIIVILIIHTYFLFLYEVPGCGRGYLGPGGYHDNGKYKGCTAGFTGYFDRLILGQRVYQYPLINEIYKAQEYDFECIFGCLTTIFQVFLGAQAGMIIITYKNHKSRLLRWLLWCVGTGLIGGALSGFSKEDGLVPLNKFHWSLSFVLVTSCFAFGLLSFCYFITEVKQWWSGKPFFFVGMNAILMFVGHNMTYSKFPVRWYLSDGKHYETHFMAMIENIWATLFWVFVSYVLYKKKIFISV